MQMQKGLTVRCACSLTLPASGDILRQQGERAPDVSVADHSISLDQLTAAQGHASDAISIHLKRSDAAAAAQGPSMPLETFNESRCDRSTSTDGVIQMGIRLKPLSEQGGHRSGIGIRRRHAADQKAEEVNPVAQKRILEMAIHQWTKTSCQMTHGREMGQQLTAPAPHLLQHLSAGTKSEQGQSGSSSGNRLKHLTKRPPLVDGLRSTEISDHGLEVVAANTDP